MQVPLNEFIEYVILSISFFWYPFEIGFNSKSLFFFLLALDGIYSTISFLRLHSRNLTQSQILEEVGCLYNIDFIDRYLYYIGVSLLYQYLNILFWLEALPTSYLRILMLAYLLYLAVPTRINNHCKTWLNPSVTLLGKMKVNISRTVCAFLLARIMNFLSLICVDLRPNIRTAELYPLMKPSTLSNTPKTLLNFLIATLVQYTQNNGRTMSSRLIRVLYRYNTGKKIGSVKSEEQAKEKLVRVLVERRFNELIRPDTLQTVFYLYQAKEDGLLYTFFTEFEFRLLQIGSIYTLTKSILGLPAFFTAILSLCLVLYRNYANDAVEHRSINTMSTTNTTTIPNLDKDEQIEARNERVVRLLVGRILGILIGLFCPQDYLLVTLVSELTYYLIVQFEVKLLKVPEVLQKISRPLNLELIGYIDYRSLLGSLTYETRYILIGLLVSNSWYRLLGSLILGPDLVTAGVLLVQSLLLRLSGFNLWHLALLMSQTLIYGQLLHSKGLISLFSHAVIPEGTEITNVKGFNLIEQLQASYHPNEDRAAKERVATKEKEKVVKVETVVKREKVEKRLEEMTDDEIKKKIELISSQSMPDPDQAPIITDQAVNAMVRSLRSRGLNQELDKSVYLDRESHLSAEEAEPSELYSEY